MKIEGPKTAGVISKSELAVVKEIYGSVKPRKEYIKGEIKLKFKQELPSGETLEAEENEWGVASIVIKHGNDATIDFAEFLPPDFKFVTPTYFNSHPTISMMVGEEAPGKWGVLPKSQLVSIGEIRRLSDVFILLHEIGHTQQTPEWDKQKEDEMPDSDNPHQKAVRSLSIDERNAWARAIQIARQIKEQKGINLFEVFKNKEEFQLFMHSALLSHKLSARKFLMSQGLDHGWEYLMSILFGKHSKDGEFVDKLFDKARLSRVR